MKITNDTVSPDMTHDPSKVGPNVALPEEPIDASVLGETALDAVAPFLDVDITPEVTSFIGDVDSGQADDPEFGFEDRVKARRVDIRDGQRRVVNETFSRYMDEEREVSPEQQELVLGIAKDIERLKGELPKDLREKLGAGTKIDGVTLKSAREAVSEERKAAMVPADIERCDKEIDILDQLIEVSDQIDLVSRFARAVNDGPDQAKAVLEDSDATTKEDSRLINGLLVRAVVASRLKGAASEVLKGDGSIDLSLGELEKIAESPVFKDEILKVATYARQRQITSEVLAVAKGVTLDDLDYERRMTELMGLPNRPTVQGFDSFEFKRKLGAQVSETLVQARRAELRQVFADGSVEVEKIIEQIMDLPSMEPEDLRLQEELLESLALYLFARREKRPDDFKKLFDELTQDVTGRLNPELPKSLELGRNLAAAKTIARRFKDVIVPIFQSARGDERTEGVGRYIRGKNGSDVGRQSYTVDVEQLSEQRELSELEREYLESVEALSIFNPHLVALLRECPEITTVALKDYFERLTLQTSAEIQDGDYVPLLLIGAGPEGITALGELMRIDPVLASRALVVDLGAVPGGPFSIPEGPAWLLNSANARGGGKLALPDSPSTIEQQTGVPEERTVRALSGPLGFYPGERLQASDTRPGSINTTVNYLPVPDQISDEQFALNEDLALIVQLQAALLANRLLSRTEVLDVRPNPDDQGLGSKLVRISITDPQGNQREITVQTDAVISSTGLGEATYGFDETPRFKRLQEATESQAPTDFPLVSTTLDAFKALAGREGPVRVIGDTIIITGSGNSTATLVELLGGIIGGSDNPTLRNINKIYIVSEGDLSKRARYKGITELRSRGGKENLVEFITGRAGDAELDEESGRVILYDQQGQPIRDSEGEVIKANSFIAGTGFRQQSERIFGSYVPEGGSMKEGAGVKSVVLPTNPDVAVGDTLEDDPTVLFVGTASRPQFNDEKLGQLPAEARRALVDNGVENAVAIGFRAPDARAAVRLLLANNPEIGSHETLEPPEAPVAIPLRPDNGSGATSLSTEMADLGTLPAVRRDVASDSSVLTPLFLGSLGRIRLTGGDTVRVDLSISEKDGRLNVETPEGSEPLSVELLGRITDGVLNRYFLSYWLKARSTRRERDGLRLALQFRGGRVDYKASYVEPV